jgi:hypothetical protein
MSKAFEFKLNEEGVGELLKSAEMVSLVSSVTENVSGIAGEGYEGNVQIGQYRAIGMVKAVTKDARADNEENNTLLRAIGG